MATLNFLTLDHPLQRGDYIHMGDSPEVQVSQDSAFRGARPFNAAIQALNTSFDAQSEEWRAKIRQIYEGGHSAAISNLSFLQQKVEQHNSSWCVWLTDWVNWFLSFITGGYESNQFASLELEKLEAVWGQEAIRFYHGYEAHESGCIPDLSKAIDPIPTTRARFGAPMPDSYTHPSHLFRERFREQVKTSVFEKVVPLRPLFERGKSLCASEGQRKVYDQITNIIAHHIELAIYLTTMKKMNYNVGFCGDINRFYYAYLNFVLEWPEGRPHIEMVNFEFPPMPPFCPGGSHAVLLVGREAQSTLDDSTKWNSAVQVLDAYEKEEELQTYAFNRRPERGTLDEVLKLGAQPVQLVTNQQIDWDQVPEPVRAPLACIHAAACLESRKAVLELLGT